MLRLRGVLGRFGVLVAGGLLVFRCNTYRNGRYLGVYSNGNKWGIDGGRL